MNERGLHMVVNDVLETPKGKEYTKRLYTEAFPESSKSWNLEVCNATDLRNIMSKNLRDYTAGNGIFDLTLCLTTGGARFFYAHPIDRYSKSIAVLPLSTTHGCSLEKSAETLISELSKIKAKKPKILVLDGEVSIFGYTEKKLDNVRNAIGEWSKEMDREVDTKIGVGVLSRGYYDYDNGFVVRLKSESDLRSSIDFSAVRGTDSVTRLSEDLDMMKERKIGKETKYLSVLFDALQKRSQKTGTLPF